jgi:penicillin-binding protein 1C
MTLATLHVKSGERTRLACWQSRPRDRELLQRRIFRRSAEKSMRRRMRSPKLQSRILHGLVFLFTFAVAVWLALPKVPLLDGISFSQCVRDRNGKLLRVTLSTDQKFRIWTPLREISPVLINATLRYEDKYYAKHPGVNPIALGRSVVAFVRFRHITAGGSTITMQVARLRFHLQTRTISGKATQILRALELERHYSKDEILEAYLNLAPYGRNIEGAGAASEIYFSKTAAGLTGPEAVALSVIPQSPTRRALSADRDNGSVNVAQNNWYDRAQVDRDNEFSARLFRARAAKNEKLLAPHFIRQVLESEKSRNQIVTTLDLEKQQLLERRISDYVAANRYHGIQNAAAFLIDARTMEVLAQVGSADFANIDINGQVDGTRALRSPGSTLKPFVYALALEQGLIHPLSILADAPRSFGEYNPENFDREFLGPIRASDALARSRNVPAVELTSHLSHPTLYEFLKTAYVRLPKPESYYGLALPLGGAEVSIQDLVRLYAALANDGELRPLRYVKGNLSNDNARKNLTALSSQVSKQTEGCLTCKRVFSPEAAFLTLEMLANVPRPEMNCADGSHSAPVFWKTGTSHGFRDAWSIAVFDHYVLAVWIGNFDGRANPMFVGRIAAAPLLFQIIDSLRASWPEANEPHLPPPGANLKRVEFCAVSGDLPNAFCKARVEGWFIPGISPIKTCDVHREVLVDVQSGLRVPIDDGTRELRREVYEFWPSDLLALFEKAGVPRQTPPPFLPESTSEVTARSGSAPKIISPSANQEILLGSGKTIPLRAKTDADVRAIYWFAGKSFIGTSDPGEVLLWKLTSGDYELTALDDHGRSGSFKVVVR